MNQPHADLIAFLHDELALANNNIQHTPFQLSFSLLHPGQIVIALHSDDLRGVACFQAHCPTPDSAVQAIWQLAAFALWQFSTELFVPPAMILTLALDD